MVEGGKSQQPGEAKAALQVWRNRNITGICDNQDIAARWGGGGGFETDEYRVAEVRLRNQSFGCIDFGENLKANTSFLEN